MGLFMEKKLTPSVNLLLYSLLLVFTPFILLQNYLQDLISKISNSTFSIGFLNIPYMLLVFGMLVGLVLFKSRRSFNFHKGFTWLFIYFLWFIGQQTTDFYLNHKFYDLQNNWHYLAYGLYVIVAYNALSHKISQKSKLILNIFLRALIISTIDEIVQIYISNRVFDVSDIAKDLWGTVAGIIILFIGYTNPEIIQKEWKIRYENTKQYFNNPLSTIFLIALFSYILLFVSSLLTSSEFVFYIVLITVFIFGFVFSIIHFTQIKSAKWILIIVFSALIIAQITSFFTNFSKNITFNQSGITIYKGIPLVYFDVLIYENGFFRFVDKKTNFNQGDLLLFFEKTNHILLIGTGEKVSGHIGFPEDLTSQFIYNFKKKRPIQVIVLPTAQACKVYNRLKDEGKKVTFVLHNTN
jgi:VanZ family protein